MSDTDLHGSDQGCMCAKCVPEVAGGFTPAPWKVWKDMDPKEPRQIVGPSDDFVCVIDEINTNKDANARLIAAAPELLRACEEAWRFIDCLMTNEAGEAEGLLTNHGDDVVERVKAAVAKAVAR